MNITWKHYGPAFVLYFINDKPADRKLLLQPRCSTLINL
ncbi:hypothetical protein T4A_4879 [Trichinella pseudospiralis]|uniref:Uncharacterized protein n=1 Tax=Trichinella pseudospiralis TaxID=6337 RepID=A0A0V1DKU2_TRIPS|nr:hypothetical protein T4A_4879 [Trichinella pseudospiralis]